MPVGMELPHLDVLHREAGAQRHADAVAGVDQRVGGGGEDAAGTAGSEYGGLGADVDDFTGFDADRDDADHIAPSWFFTMSVAYHSLKNTVLFFRLAWYSVCSMAWPVRSAAAQVRAAWPPLP